MQIAKPIELGDKVWAYNIETGETELKEVTRIYVHSVDEILHLYTDEGTIDTTTNHPFYVIGKGWVAAGNLEIGDEVYNLNGTTSVVLGSEIEKLDEPLLVYNLEVGDFHSYFVGDMPVLVHNSCRTPKNNATSVKNADGSTTYTKNNTSVKYTNDYPDFTPYQYNGNDGKSSVAITYSGNRNRDYQLANAAAGFTSTPEGYTWHHVEDGTTMLLVESSVHSNFPHTGGFSINKNK